MGKREVLEDFKQSTADLLEAFSEFPETRFNDRPDKASWSAGMVGEHLIKVETGTLRLFSGGTKPAGRSPDEKIDKIEQEFLNFEKSFTAFGPIVPDDTPKEKEKVINKLQDIRQRLAGMIELQDLSEVVTGFEHPLFGALTRVEWIYFNIIHSKRHLNQLRDLNATLSP